ncbi:PREDICTED: pleckstrin homology domain-containing family J member 1 isoform X1 [Cercocebus atys]|uniref:pleckstrin homology domain-containing family J member 1 isoform X1 n=1 Tax=Cercocebus atys TaxID=9531 RepID=UPI0005F52DA3|nr:PREDICTED: pleckstrin homology domain-containing family J member 1 isoform X1 [Cercocebus atys]
MRYNEKELQALSRQPAEMAAELGMRGPKKGSVLKRRLVKLVVNFLFYFRTDEAEVGASRARGRVPGWGPAEAGCSPLRPGARVSSSPSEPCCWSGAESSGKSPAPSPSLRVHAAKPRLLQERNPEGDRQGPPGAVRHIRGGQVPAEWLAGMSAGHGGRRAAGQDWPCPAVSRLAMPGFCLVFGFWIRVSLCCPG